MESITETFPYNTRIHLGFTMLSSLWMDVIQIRRHAQLIHPQGIKKKVRNICSETASSPATASPAPLPGQCGGRWILISNGEREEDEEEREDESVCIRRIFQIFFFPCCVSVVVVVVVAWGCDFCCVL